MPIRVCNDAQDLVNGGQTYQRFPFELVWPDDTEDVPAGVTLRIANADRQISLAVRRLSGPALTAELKVVLASAPELVEAGPLQFTLRDVTYDAGVVEGTLRFEDILNEPVPADSFDPGRFPGIF